MCESDVLINKGKICELSFFVDIEHNFCFNFGEQVGISFKTHVQILIFLRWLLQPINLRLHMLLDVLTTIDVVFMLIELWVWSFESKVASCFWHVSYKYQIKYQNYESVFRESFQDALVEHNLIDKVPVTDLMGFQYL